MNREDYFIFKDGTLKMRNTTLYFITKDEKIALPIEKISSIFFMGSGKLTTGVIKELNKYGITVNFFDYYGYYIGSYFPKKSRISGEMLVRQAKHYLDNNKRLFLAKQFVIGSMKNIVRVLKRRKIKSLDIPNLDDIDNINKLMQKEGQFRYYFYKTLDEKLPDGFKIINRVIRPPNNRANALISFFNSLVYSMVANEIYFTYLDPTISFLHKPFERRFSLSLDVAEIFKPILSENLYLKMINQNKLDPDIDFIDDKGVFLSKNGRIKATEVFKNYINNTIRMRKNNQKRSIKYLIRLELYKLEKHFLDMKKYKPLVMWW